jgi:hypothetical protein
MTDSSSDIFQMAGFNEGKKASGYVRVVNYRLDMAPDSQPEEDESVVVVDRRNPTLGNKHILFRKGDLRERERALAAFSRDLEADFQRKGAMYLAVYDLAERVLAGEKITLQCACKPSPCHGDVIAKKVNELVATIKTRVDRL